MHRKAPSVLGMTETTCAQKTELRRREKREEESRERREGQREKRRRAKNHKEKGGEGTRADERENRADREEHTEGRKSSERREKEREERARGERGERDQPCVNASLQIPRHLGKGSDKSMPSKGTGARTRGPPCLSTPQCRGPQGGGCAQCCCLQK